MGLISKITNKIESKILHRDGLHSYPAELPPKDNSPHIDPSAPSPGEGIHAEDFAHRSQAIRRSESARRSDHDHELPIPNSSETRIGGQQRYYAQRRGESPPQRQQELHEPADEYYPEEVDPIQRQPDDNSLAGPGEYTRDVHGTSSMVERNGVVRVEDEAEAEAEALRRAQKVIDEKNGLEKLGVVGI